jgi:hypothetical protein
MNKILVYGGGIVAAGVVYAYVAKIGPFAPKETGIDPTKKLTGGEGLSAEDTNALGLAPGAAPTSSKGGDLYRVAIDDYFKRVWRPRGVGVPYNLSLALPEGEYGKDSVTQGTNSARIASAFRLENMNGQTVTGTGYKISTGTGRGFAVNQYQVAVYLPDTWRVFGLVRAVRRVLTPAGASTFREVDGFVTAAANQGIDDKDAVYGLGQIYAWDPVANEWVPPEKIELQANPARAILRGGRMKLNDAGELLVGYRDVAGKRIYSGDLLELANNGRVKAKPV